MANKSKLWFVESSGMLSPSQFLESSAGSLDSGLKLKSAQPPINPSWRFCGSHDVLHKIWMNSSSAVIFFNGASKGNPGDSRASGLVFSPDSLTNSSFSWGIGSLTNNQAECYSLFMASQIAMEKGYKSVQIFGDSEMLIKP